MTHTFHFVTIKVRIKVKLRVNVKVKLGLGLGSAKVEVLQIWSCPFSIIVSKLCPNGCDVIWSIRQWRNWTSIWESKKRPYIWELDADLRIGCRLETGRRFESDIYIYHYTQKTPHFPYTYLNKNNRGRNP
jgi:hypothetical protein